MADESKPGAGTPLPPADQPERNPFRRVQFVIEFATGQNNQTLCPITRRTYRGRWQAMHLKGRVPDDRFDLAELPGHTLVYDGAKRTVTVVDPLSLPSNRELLLQAQRACQQMNWGKPEADKQRLYDRLTDDRLKAFAYWSRRWLDAKQVVLLEGAVPPMEDVERLPGRVERNTYDSSARRERFPADVPRYLTPAEAAGESPG